MSTIVANQQRAYEAQAQDAMRRLVPAMTSLCEPQRAAMLALLAAATATPVDITLLGVRGDAAECASLLDGVLTRGHSTHSWLIGSGCEFLCSVLPGEDDHVQS